MRLRYLSVTRQPLLILLSAMIFTASFIPALARSRTASNVVSCNADGIVKTLSTEPLSIGDVDELFTINLLFNDYSFTQAKVIDACWDVGVGRGGQAIAELVAHRVLRRAMLLVLERSEISIPNTTAMFCQQIPAYVDLGTMSRDIQTLRRRIGAKACPSYGDITLRAIHFCVWLRARVCNHHLRHDRVPCQFNRTLPTQQYTKWHVRAAAFGLRRRGSHGSQ